MRTYFRHRDDIRHYISSKNDAWDGIYDFSKNAIIYEKKIYKSINEFAVSHYNSFGLAHLENRVDAWCECDCIVNGAWVGVMCVFCNKHWC
jgi:hypothetical protein